MASTFALVIVVLTIITGVMWFLDKFKWAPKRREKVELLRVQYEGKIDGKTLAEYARRHPFIENTASFFPILLFILIVRSFLYEPYQIPSGSMIPSLLIGDFIAVQKFSYGIKNPITNSTWIKTGEPERGDVVVFKYPKNPSIDYIKRVVGLPGDKIEYNPYSKELTIYPGCGDKTDCGIPPLNLNYTPLELSNFVQSFDNNNNSYFYTVQQAEATPNLKNIQLLTRKETLGKYTHNIFVIGQPIFGAADFYQQPGQEPLVWVVPKGEYFMMGDNRDDSSDSRFWGFVPEANLIGKATMVWFSLDKQANQWPTGVRFSRIGSFIHK